MCEGQKTKSDNTKMKPKVKIAPEKQIRKNFNIIDKANHF